MISRAKLNLLVVTMALFCLVGFARAGIVQKGTLRLKADADLSPRRLPRSAKAPVAVSIASRLSTTDGSVPPALKTIRIELNRHGTIDTTGLPECRPDQIQPASTSAALKACRAALVGAGSFSVDVLLGAQQPYPTKGRLLLFNGSTSCHPTNNSTVRRLNPERHARRGSEAEQASSRNLIPLRREPSRSIDGGGHAATIQNLRSAGRDHGLIPFAKSRVSARRGSGPAERPTPHAQGSQRRDTTCHTRPALLGQIYSAHPFANSFIIPFEIGSRKYGPYGVRLTATLPPAFTSWGHITALKFSLSRRYRYEGARHSFLSAGCPTPDGISNAAFSLARSSFSFANGVILTTVLGGSCTAL
jgi:hypothetical protein